MIRVELPPHLRTLARVEGEVRVEVVGEVTAAAILDSLEERFPMLKGTIRNRSSGRRRAFVRFFACGEDLSHQAMDHPLPAKVARAEEPFLIVGALAGG